MKQLPKNIFFYKKTPEFTETSVPVGLLNDHQTKEGVWGKIIVLEGELEYTIIEPEKEIVLLHKDKYGVVEPTVFHHVTPQGKVRFYVEFHR